MPQPKPDKGPQPSHHQPGHPPHTDALTKMTIEHATSRGHSLGDWKPVKGGGASDCKKCGLGVVVHHSKAGGLYGGPALSNTCHPKPHHAKINEVVATIQAGNPDVPISLARRIATQVVALQVEAEAGNPGFTIEDTSMPNFQNNDDAGQSRAKDLIHGGANMASLYSGAQALSTATHGNVAGAAAGLAGTVKGVAGAAAKMAGWGYGNEKYVNCEQGHKHWGAGGAAGMLIRHHGDDGQTRYLLQHRSPWVDHGNTWSVPGGALDEGETPEKGAHREAAEEMGKLPKLKHAHTVTDDHGGWGYHTVVADAPHQFEPEGDEDNEHKASGWFTPHEISKLPLHPGFAASWDKVRKSGVLKAAA